MSIEGTPPSPHESTLLLPEGTRLLHIGPHKTGTTSLQNSIRANREEILRQGVYYGAPEGRLASNRIARSLLRLPFKNPDEIVEYEEWEDQVARVRASSARRVIVSGEEFSFCEKREIRTLLNDLGKDRVHVVVTVRPLAKVLPSQWQLDLRGSFTSGSFDEWLRWTLKPQGLRKIAMLLGIPHPFWFRHRHDELVTRWAAEVGADHQHVAGRPLVPHAAPGARSDRVVVVGHGGPVGMGELQWGVDAVTGDHGALAAGLDARDRAAGYELRVSLDVGDERVELRRRERDQR